MHPDDIAALTPVLSLMPATRLTADHSLTRGDLRVHSAHGDTRFEIRLPSMLLSTATRSSPLQRALAPDVDVRDAEHADPGPYDRWFATAEQFLVGPGLAELALVDTAGTHSKLKRLTLDHCTQIPTGPQQPSTCMKALRHAGKISRNLLEPL